MKKIAYFNGEFLPEEQCRIGIDDGGFLHGAGLFETMRAEGGQVFLLEQHMSRLCRSASKLLRPIESSMLPTSMNFQELLERHGRPTARIRLTVTAGSMRTASDETEPRLNVCATVSSLTEYSPKLYEHGVTAVICDYRLSPSDPLAGHKTTCYLPKLMALRTAQAAGCMEALWFTTGNLLAEGSISNVFLVRDGSLLTPSLETPVLPGVVRGAVIKSAQSRGVTVEQRSLTVDDLLDANEVFLTNTMMKVLPVCSVEKHTIADGKVGDMTRVLSDDLNKLIRSECGRS